MNTRTRTIAMAAALAAAAAVLSAGAADQGASGPADAKEGVQHLAEQKAPERAQRNANAAPLPSRIEPTTWWARERAEDDGYAWPLPPAASRGTATISPAAKVDDAR
jgi:hypothetical protein